MNPFFEYMIAPDDDTSATQHFTLQNQRPNYIWLQSLYRTLLWKFSNGFGKEKLPYGTRKCHEYTFHYRAIFDAYLADTMHRQKPGAQAWFWISE
jgi:hypothetical protein